MYVKKALDIEPQSVEAREALRFLLYKKVSFQCEGGLIYMYVECHDLTQVINYLETRNQGNSSLYQ